MKRLSGNAKNVCKSVAESMVTNAASVNRTSVLWSMRLYYRCGGKDIVPESFGRVCTEVDGSGSALRELLAYVRAGDSVTVELGGAAGAFGEAVLALYQRQATLL